MGPLFSLIILGVVGGVASLLAFIVLRFFLPTRDAVLAALLTVVSGGGGCLLGMLAQALVFPLSNPSGAQIIDFFWISLATGAASAGLALRLFMKVRAARAERRRVETFD